MVVVVVTMVVVVVYDGGSGSYDGGSGSYDGAGSGRYDGGSGSYDGGSGSYDGGSGSYDCQGEPGDLNCNGGNDDEQDVNEDTIKRTIPYPSNPGFYTYKTQPDPCGIYYDNNLDGIDDGECDDESENEYFTCDKYEDGECIIIVKEPEGKADGNSKKKDKVYKCAKKPVNKTLKVLQKKCRSK